MATLAKIEKLLEEGDYLGANKLADEFKTKDCQHFNQNLPGINDISKTVNRSISLARSLEDKITSYELEMRKIKDVASLIEENNHAVEVQCRNLEDTCNLIDEMITNLHITDNVERILVEGNLNDKSSTEAALNELDRVLNYKIDPNLVRMKCVRNQKDRANIIHRLSSNIE